MYNRKKIMMPSQKRTNIGCERRCGKDDACVGEGVLL